MSEIYGGTVINEVKHQVAILLRIVLPLFFVVFITPLTAPKALSSDAHSLFTEKCAGCHTIGGGNLVGPDLAPSISWSPSDLRKAIKRMEKNVGPLTSEEVDSLVEYLRKANAKVGLGGNARTPEPEDQKQIATQPVILLEPSSAVRGNRLFVGAEPLKNGGLSCIACHSVDGRGGTLGTDLTDISLKLSEQALVSATEHAPYKVMKAAYRDHPIIHQESLDLKAYLFSLKEPHKKPNAFPVAAVGLALAVLVLGIIAFGYRDRNKSARIKLKRRR